MDSDQIRETPIDLSLSHCMEEQALTSARAKSQTDHERAVVDHLIQLRESLMVKRAHFNNEAMAKRHARGEIYSKAKVASINSVGPSKEELDQSVRLCYESQPDAIGVLKNHALSHFGYGLVSQRYLLSHTPDDILERAREMQEEEEAFASKWLEAIGDPAFRDQVFQVQRDTIAMLRTSSSGMFLVTQPACPLADAVDATALGRAWNKLDSQAREMGVKELSTFIGIDGQAPSDSSPVEEVLPTVEALIEAFQDGKLKLPAKQAIRESLGHIRDALRSLHPLKGRAHFEVDL